jgi:hypothetical protein
MQAGRPPRQSWWFRKLRFLLQWVVALPLPRFGSVHLAYHPDTYTMVQGQPDFGVLVRRFTRFNRRNNSGDVHRLWTFMLNLQQIISDDIPGDFAELGVWRGNTASVLAHYADACGRRVVLFDTFEGFDKRDMSGVDESRRQEFDDTSVQLVTEVIGSASRCCDFVKGRFPDSLRPEHRRAYAVVSLDCDLYEPMRAALDFFHAHMPRGGLLLIHDYMNPAWDGVKLAVDEFCARTGEFVVCIGDKSGSAVIRKSRGPAPA